MKKKAVISLLLAMVLVVSMLAGCSSGSSSSTGSGDSEGSANATGTYDPSVIEEGTTLTFWHAMSGDNQTTLQELTDKFNAENEYGITVNLEYQGSYSDLSTKLTASAAAGTLPNMAQAYNNVLMEYLDYIVDLTGYIDTDDTYDWEDILPGYREECSEFGIIHAVPFNKSTYVFFYDADKFEEAGLAIPTTWDELKEIGTQYVEYFNQPMIGYDDVPGMLEAYILQAGSEYVSSEGALFDNDEGMAAIEFIMDLYNSGIATLVDENDYFSTMLVNGNVGGYIGSSAGVSFLTGVANLGVATIPYGENKEAYAAGTNVVMFESTESEQAACWEYMKFLTSTESTVTWAEATGYLPVSTSGFESEEYQNFMANDATASAAYAQSDYYFISSTFEGSNEIRDEMDSVMQTLILDGADAQTAMDTIVSAINKIVAQYN